ncbi:hypothetical protein ACNTMW_22675 [Planosporangium sp. 12N6]|uniref:hypothetical protein n=1 Tax=Planosporangium spinosum TaxID=3402278 RepID=UPI003CECF378
MATVLVVFGALVTVQQVSSAKSQRFRPVANTQCGPVAPGPTAPNGQDVTTTQQNGRTVRQHWGDGQRPKPGCPGSTPSSSPSGAGQTVDCPTVADKLPAVPAAAKAEVDQNLAQLETQIADANKQLAASKGQGGANFVNNSILGPLASKRTATINRIATAIGRVAAKPTGLDQLAKCTVSQPSNNGGNNGGANGGNTGGNNNGGNTGNNNGGNNGGNNLNILADRCRGGSNLQLHDGFQNGNRCVDTEMGEVGDAAKNPSLLITQAPQQVGVNQPFTIRVSTRNLIRDRFLAAGQGGYYVEMSKLNAQGLVRGHFHTSCRMLDSTDVAPDPAPAPAFFVATEDNAGGAQADQIVIQVPGLPQKGIAQCASWAGDGSHRLPMMQRANQQPAFDVVRINVN